MSLLEERVPLSESVLWTIQKRFYETKGISAWGQKIVPCYITTNPWMATQYAKVVVGYLQDMICAEALGVPESEAPKFDPEEPFYILEYGAGSGRLGFYFLKAIQKMRETLGFLRKVKLVYIMSDFTMSNVRYWMEHEKLQEFFDAGMLDCAIVDAQTPNADIHLLKRGITLTTETVVNPLVAIGNYFFCVVAADAFLVDKQGKLSESLLTTRSPVENDNMDDVTILERVRKTFTQVPVQAATRYHAPDHPALNKVLQEYHDILATKGYATSFLLPSGVARSIEGLVRLCKNHDNILVFCGDKGYNDLSEFEGRVGYPMSVEGSFSFMANMDAMGRYFIARGGSALANPMKVEAQGDTCLAVACYTTRGDLRNLPNTYNAFQTSLSDFGPTDFYQMVHVMSVCETGQLPPEVMPVADLNPENRYLDPNGDLTELSAADSPPVAEQPLDTPEMRLRYQSCVREADTCGYSLQQCLALLRMSQFDPYVFWQLRPRLLVLTSIALEEERNEIHHALRQVFDNYFHINEEEDLPFEIGRLAYQLHLDNYRFALEMYMKSLRLFGEHYITFYNIALCHNELGEFQTALEFLDRAISLNPDYSSAVTARTDVLAQLSKRAGGNAVAN